MLPLMLENPFEPVAIDDDAILHFWKVVRKKKNFLVLESLELKIIYL